MCDAVLPPLMFQKLGLLVLGGLIPLNSKAHPTLRKPQIMVKYASV